MNSYYFFKPYDIHTKGIDKPYNEQIKMLKKEIETADAIMIGAGAGLSTAAGLTYSGERFDKYFFDFRD
ncbi:MAG: Sir2 silent information regulator family NAD-dependent deacetylase, partial [Lachnospiraceae bacterium]|nr:Sir2 silent information regulator family NAD-dependent deacetylase [Lachnospiraceae bacterium]